MSTALTFHLPPDANPDALAALFECIERAGVTALTPTQLRADVAELLGRQPRGEVLALARDLDLVRPESGGFRITERGRFVGTQAGPTDLAHGLCYFAWNLKDPGRLTRMWTYRAVVDLLWDRSPATLDAACKKEIVENLLSSAYEQFHDLAGFEHARTSIGPKTVDGALRWLERLSPHIIHGRRIERRQRCPPQLMAMALSETVRAADSLAGTDFRLGSAEREKLCRVCFIEPAGLDSMLEWTMQTQPLTVRWGTTSGRYGKQVVVLGHANQTAGAFS